MNKKTIGIIVGIIIVIVVAIVGIKLGSNKTTTSNENVEGSLSSIMKKLYEGIPEDDIPYVDNTKVTADNIEYYLGTSDIDYSEGLASEPLMSSVAHSVVLLRLNNARHAEAVKQKIEENVDPAKWVCVQVDRQNVKVASKGNLVVLIMDDEIADKILENFNNL